MNLNYLYDFFSKQGTVFVSPYYFIDLHKEFDVLKIKLPDRLIIFYPDFKKFVIRMDDYKRDGFLYVGDTLYCDIEEMKFGFDVSKFQEHVELQEYFTTKERKEGLLFGKCGIQYAYDPVSQTIQSVLSEEEFQSSQIEKFTKGIDHRRNKINKLYENDAQIRQNIANMERLIESSKQKLLKNAQKRDDLSVEIQHIQLKILDFNVI